jgi:hypothetical protein
MIVRFLLVLLFSIMLGCFYVVYEGGTVSGACSDTGTAIRKSATFWQGGALSDLWGAVADLGGAIESACSG